MIWLTWRQHRLQAAVGVAGLMAFGLFVLINGLHHDAVFRQLGLGSCHGSVAGNCGDLADSFLSRIHGGTVVAASLFALPALVGLFVGAPMLAREVEQGTHRLVWTQGVTRTRWFAARSTFVGAAALALAALFSVASSWWLDALHRAGQGRLVPGQFDIQGVVPIAYAVFAFALGLAAGATIRRAVPAMATTLGVFFGVRVGVAELLRPHYLKPLTASFGLTANGAGIGVGDWIMRNQIVGPAGQLLKDSDFMGLCHVTRNGKDSVVTCLASHGFHFVDVYQPASRFWAFQGIESALFVVLAAALLVLAAWWVRRRIS
jgi:hypothetical protein